LHPPASIRPARDEDGRAAVGALARAFWGDPFLVHFYPDEVVRARRIERFFQILWNASLPLGCVEVSDCCGAVALWRPPSRWRIERRTIAANLPAMLFAYRLATARVIRCLATMEKHHPRQRHWYLATIGTDPARQGQGLAGRLIRSGLERCDAAGEPAYLEAASQDLVPFYEGMGFRLLGEVKVPAGPVFYPMWRDPK
jgi:ribosomal protein S18 acetylase RimI-like enzyme